MGDRLNYRHSFHAGNFADAVKHVLLVGLLRALQRKEAGFLYLETHAGRGSYDLAAAGRGDRLPRQPEHPGGIGRLWERPDLPPLVADYVGRVRDFNGTGALRRYPGSPRLARLLARPGDRLALCERHPEECAALRREFGGERRVSVQERDGYGALAAMLPPPERRGLILIDPPFEAEDEWEAIRGALAEGLRRFPAGVYAVWHPLTARASGPRPRAIASIAPVPILAAEVTVDPAAEGLLGCGLLVFNPPWQFEDEARAVLPYLARVLAQAPNPGWSLRWLRPRA